MEAKCGSRNLLLPAVGNNGVETDLSNSIRSCTPRGTTHGFKNKHLSAYWLHEGFSALQTSEAHDTSKTLKVG